MCVFLWSEVDVIEGQVEKKKIDLDSENNENILVFRFDWPFRGWKWCAVRSQSNLFLNLAVF